MQGECCAFIQTDSIDGRKMTRFEKRMRKKHLIEQSKKQWEKSETGKNAAVLVPMLDRVFLLTKEHDAKKWHYNSEFYFRGHLELKRKNPLVRFVPNRRFFEHGGRHLLTEACGEMSYYDPGKFSRHISYTYGAEPDVRMTGDDLLNFFHLTIYDEYLLGDHILSPFSISNAYCYRYRIDSIHGSFVYFTFKARSRNTQLVNGNFIYNSTLHSLMRLSFWGEYGFVKFRMNVHFGTSGKERYWPSESELMFNYTYFGNKFVGQCHMTQKYKLLDDKYNPPSKQSKRYDVSDQYVVSVDTTQAIVDSMEVAKRRTYPLTLNENQYYYEASRKRAEQRAAEAADSLEAKKGKKSGSWFRAAGKAAEMLVRRHSFDISPKSYASISSPHVSFSGWRGVSYRQDVEYCYETEKGRRFSIDPTVGYNFRPKQFVWLVYGDYLYSPRINARLSFEGGTFGRVHSADRLINRMKDENDVEDQETNVDDDVLFNDMYAELQHSFEPLSGLKILVGGVFHNRSPYHVSKERMQILGLKNSYKYFAPRLNIEFTPCQRYYMKGNRRVAVDSKWPTFCVDYERGVNGVFQSESDYEKWEFTITYAFTFDALHRILTKLGGGAFTKKKNLDFVEFRYFYNGIVDYNWNDDVGGVFQLLDGKYYNDTYHYMRAHVVYETPTLLLRNLSTRYLRGERIYLNTLLTPSLRPYIELGYGLSSHILDLSGFASFVKGKYDGVGVKFTLHLFD